MLPLLVAYLLGALVIEKHFTHDKSLPGNDHYHAMTHEDLRQFRNMVERTRRLMGPTSVKAPIATEAISRQNARRSIVLRHSVPQDYVLKEADLITKRPGSGITPLFWDEVVGRRTRISLNEDHILQWHDIEAGVDHAR